MATETKIKGKLRAQGGVKVEGQTSNRVPILDGSNDLVSSAVTSTELGHLSGVTSAIQTQINDANTAISDHISAASDAHAASAITNTPSGNLAATDQQAANNELQADIDTRALDSEVIKKDGSVTFTATQSMGGFKLTGVAEPTGDQDAATKAYVDAVAQGLNLKSSAKSATISPLPSVTAAGTKVNKTLTADSNGVLDIDGVNTYIDIDTDGGSTNPVDSVGTRASRVLVQNQVDAKDNGIYAVKDKGSAGSPFILIRAVDCDGSPGSEVDSAFIFIREGATNLNSGFVVTTINPNIDVQPLNFTQFSGAGQIVAGAALEKTGNVLDVKVDGQGIEISADQLTIELDGSTLSKSVSGLKLSDTAVTPASLGSASQSLSVTVDQQGRLTAASAQSISIASSQVSDFNEAAQDAVGTILTDSSSIDFTYNDAGDTITAVVLPAGVDHDSLLNYSANRHIDHTAVEIQTQSNSGLSGGGDITSTRSLLVDITGTTAETTPAANDEILIWDVSANARRKMTRANFLGTTGSAGDISETSFAAANNVAAPASITGLTFANATVRSFEALVSVYITATAELSESFKVLGTQKSSGWDISVISTGDDSGIVLSITSAGQIQYTSTNSAGFVSSAVRFRAITTGV